MRHLMSYFLFAFLCSRTFAADTVVEHDLSKYHGGAGLGTMGYPSTDVEKTQLAGVNGATNKDGHDELAGNTGKRVAWFGIVREIKEDKANKKTEILLEHKFFDGLTDLHIQIVSVSGGGDVRVILSGVDLKIPKQALVRVVGKVTAEEKNTPSVAADYLRYWEKGHYAFMPYGTDKSNPRWTKLRKNKDENDVYTSRPDDAYYQKLLGDE